MPRFIYTFALLSAIGLMGGCGLPSQVASTTDPPVPSTSEATMSSIYGIWRHEMASTVMTHEIREDGSYETHMVYAMGSCRQHIFHYGTLDVGDASLRLSFESGETEMMDCEDSSRNFGRRGFTDAEIAEATGLLDQEIPYTVDGDRLTMTVKGPMGEMEVVYARQAE